VFYGPKGNNGVNAYPLAADGTFTATDWASPSSADPESPVISGEPRS
jgi:hypothetical protein